MSSDSKPAKSKKSVSAPRPSASILLISATNQILLLHRVRTSSAFPSAHVFPGGNLSAEQDGPIPGVEEIERHQDSKVYRMGAIRECFEESGILIAKRADMQDRMLELSDREREEGRHAIHENRVKFGSWVQEQGGIPDIDNLTPFTRWITPTNIPKRFTTQMYLYFLPLKSTSLPLSDGSPAPSVVTIPNPTSDGGLEHTAARFLPASEWISMAQSDEIILPPPQYLLLHLLSNFLQSDTNKTSNFAQQREELLDFVHSGDPPWTEKCISPRWLMMMQADGRAVFGLDRPGKELEGSGKKGDSERVMLAKFDQGGARNVEVRWKKDMLRDERSVEQKL